MACATPKCPTEKELTIEQQAIPTTMAGTSPPGRQGDRRSVRDGEQGGECKFKGLKDQGYIDRPTRCQYAITDTGRTTVATA